MSRETQYVNVVEVLRKPTVELEQTEEEFLIEMLTKAMILGVLVTGCILLVAWGH